MNDMLPEVCQAVSNTIGSGLARAVRRYPDREAIIFKTRCWTYKTLNEAVNRVAHTLLGQGLKKGDRIAAYGKNSDTYLILWLACARAGFVHVPINFALINDELSYLINQSGARAIFCDEALVQSAQKAMQGSAIILCGTFHAPTPTSIDILKSTQSDKPSTSPTTNVLETDLVQILYTSGTTSHPKGAMHTHRSFMIEYSSCIQHLELAPQDRNLAALPLYHSAQMHVFTMPALMVGATNIIIDTPTPIAIFEAISQQQLNTLFAPPTVWISLLRDNLFDPHTLSTLNKIYYGASIMPESIVAELNELLPNARLFNCYGQSEIAPLATVLSPQDLDGRLASVGKPTLSVETRIIDPTTLVDCQPHERGEIIHRSPHLMIGYWDKPKETAEAFSGGWFHSGDLGYVDDEGFIYIVDRIKDVVNTGGVLVASRDVEEALYRHAAVAEVAVIGTPHDKWIEAIIAIVVLKPNEETDPETLLAHCQQHLATFKVPKAIIFQDKLPKNTAGKLLKRALRDQYEQHFAHA